MNHEPFVIERIYDAPVERVWQAITNRDQMKEWYFDIAEFKPEVGFEFSFTGGDENNTYLHLCKVTEVINQKKLTYTWKYKGQNEATYVTWELFNEDGKTRVKLTHEGLERIEIYGAPFVRENFAEGWNHIVGIALKDFTEQQ